MLRFPEELAPTETSELCSFWVPTLPIQQGSHQAQIVRPKYGKPYAIVKESMDAALRAWRKRVTQAAELEMLHLDRIEKPAAAKVWVHFVMARPKATKLPTRLCNVSPDLDKLGRAVGDALTGVCYGDDGLINAWHMEKRTAEPDEDVGAHITVYREELL